MKVNDSYVMMFVLSDIQNKYLYINFDVRFITHAYGMNA